MRMPVSVWLIKESVVTQNAHTRGTTILRCLAAHDSGGPYHGLFQDQRKCHIQGWDDAALV
jgi:hypothetical protein